MIPMTTIAICLAMFVTSTEAFAPSCFPKHVDSAGRGKVLKGGKENELRVRIKSVGNTQKITEAMRLVAAAKVRRAQQSVLATRPFSETLQSVFGGLMTRIGTEKIDLPLLKKREVSKVTLVVCSGDRGLCGGYNSFCIKKAEARIKELKSQVKAS